MENKMIKPAEVTDANFETEILKSEIPSVVDFWAVWCGPCKLIAPYLEQLASEFESKVKIAKMNVDNNPVTPSKYGIRSIPTVLFIKDGKVTDQVIGAQPKAVFEEKIKKML
jgi:thioredoxin